MRRDTSADGETGETSRSNSPTADPTLAVGGGTVGFDTQTADFEPLQAIVALGVFQALAMVAGIARVKVLAIMLGPPGVGVAAVIDQVISLVVQIGSLSIPFAALKFISRAQSKAGADVNELHRALTNVLIIGSSVAALIALVLAVLWPAIFGSGLRDDIGAVVVGLVGVPAVALGSMQRNVLAAHRGHRESAYVGLAAAISLVGASYIGVRIWGLTGLFLGNLAVAVLTVVMTQRYLTRRFAAPALSFRVAGLRALRDEPGLIGFAGSLYVLALTSPITYLASRSLILERFGAESAGFVASAYGVAVSLRLVLNQANGLYLTPLVNRQGPVEVRARATAEYMRILTVLFVLAATLIVLFPQQVISLLYASRFAPAATLVGAFVVAEGALLLAGVYQTLLVGIDDIAGFLGSTVTGHLFTLALIVPFAGTWGPLGVGVAFVLGNGLILALTVARLFWRHRIRETLRPLPLVVLGATVVSLAAWTAIAFPHLNYGIRFGVYVMAAMGLMSVLKRDERDWLMSPMVAVFRRLMRHQKPELR